MNTQKQLTHREELLRHLAAEALEVIDREPALRDAYRGAMARWHRRSRAMTALYTVPEYFELSWADSRALSDFDLALIGSPSDEAALEEKYDDHLVAKHHETQEECLGRAEHPDRVLALWRESRELSARMAAALREKNDYSDVLAAQRAKHEARLAKLGA